MIFSNEQSAALEPEQTLDEQQAEIAKQQELLDRDREIRELRALATIDAVFLTVEPNDRSYHPSGKQVLLA